MRSRAGDTGNEVACRDGKVATAVEHGVANAMRRCAKSSIGHKDAEGIASARMAYLGGNGGRRRLADDLPSVHAKVIHRVAVPRQVEQQELDLCAEATGDDQACVSPVERT